MEAAAATTATRVPTLLVGVAAWVLHISYAVRSAEELGEFKEWTWKERSQKFRCEMLSHVLDCSEPVVQLGDGTFGMVWHARDLRGREGSSGWLLFHKEVAGKDVLKEEFAWAINQAKKECQTSDELERGPDSDDYSGHGEELFVKCFGHNLDLGVVRPDLEPMYVLLEYAGTSVEKYYMQDGAWSLAAVRQLTKQILLGLEYLQSFRRTWIHHDLKTQNLVVSGEGDRLQLKFIDLGSAVHHTLEGRPWCKFIAGSIVNSPMEFELPSAFDAFSFGTVLLEMVTGLDMDGALTGMKFNNKTWQWEQAFVDSEKGPAINWDMQRAIFEMEDPLGLICGWLQTHQAPFQTKVKPASFKAWAPVLCGEVLADGEARSFITKALKTLSFRPEERPLPAQLLQDPWMRPLAA